MDLAYFQSYDCVCDFITSIREPKETISSPLAVTITPLDSGGGKDCNLHLRLPVLQPPSCLHPSLHPSAVASPTIFATCFFKCASLVHSFDPHGAGLELWRRWSLSFFFFLKTAELFCTNVLLSGSSVFHPVFVSRLNVGTCSCWCVCLFILENAILTFQKFNITLKHFLEAFMQSWLSRRQKSFSR